VINTATNTVITTIPTSGHPDVVAVSPDGTHAYVTTFTDGTVLVIDTATNTVITTIPVGVVVVGVAVSPDGTVAYVTELSTGTVVVIDTASNTVIATIPVGAGPASVAFSPDGTHVYVTNSNDRTVSVISVAAAPIDNFHPPDLFGELLGAVIRDGGGWFVIGNHFIPIPPRSPLISIIARAVAPDLGRAIANPKLARHIRNLLQAPNR
jgi:YVTN family beta-propeller protein